MIMCIGSFLSSYAVAYQMPYCIKVAATYHTQCHYRTLLTRVVQCNGSQFKQYCNISIEKSLCLCLASVSFIKFETFLICGRDP